MTHNHILATYGDAGIIRVWDLETGKERLSVGSGGAGICQLKGASDGNVLASLFDDSSVCCWNVQTGQEMLRIAKHASETRTIALADDGSVLAIAREDGTIAVWATPDGKCLAELPTSAKGTRELLLSPRGELIVAVDRQNTVHVVEVSTGRTRVTFSLNEPGWDLSTFLSPDGTRLAAIGESISFWETRTGRLLSRQAVETGYHYRSSRFSDDGSRFLAVFFSDLECKWQASVYDMRASSPRILAQFGESGERMDHVALGPEGLCLVGEDGLTSVVRVWRRFRPEHWWGVLCRIESWCCVVLVCLWLRILVRSCRLMHKQKREGV